MNSLNIKQDLQNTFVGHEESRHNDVTWSRKNIEASVAYTHIIKPDVSDITVRSSVSKIWGERPSHYWVNGIENNRSVSGGSPFIPTIQADYKHKFKAGTLATGAKLTYRRNDVYHEFYQLSGNNLKNSSTNKSRMIWLGVSYNFNSFKQKSNQKTETDRSLIKLGL